MNDYKINYIATFYVGEERGYPTYVEKFKTDPLYFAKIHLEFLRPLKNNIKRATFVFNGGLSDEIFQELLQLPRNPDIELEIIFRENSAFSYGAWDSAITRNINDFDYFFIIEDDYIPVTPNFYKYFIEKSSYDFPYVCQFVDPNYTKETPYHPSISNGLLRAENCRIIFEKYGEVFKISQGKHYQIGWDNQVSFYRHFVAEDFGALDILDKYSVPFACINNNPPIKYFGDPNNPPLIVPIEVV